MKTDDLSPLPLNESPWFLNECYHRWGRIFYQGLFLQKRTVPHIKIISTPELGINHEEGELCPVLRHVRCPWQTLCLDMNDPETSRFGREINCSKNITGQGWGGELGLIRVILTGALGSWKNHLSILLPHFNFPMLLLEQFIKNLVCVGVCVCVCVHARMRALRCHVWPCMTLWTGACQTPLSMKFS